MVPPGAPFVAQLRPGASLFLPVAYYDPRALAERDLRLWPSPHRRRRFKIINAGDVLDDVVTGIIPNIDAEREVGSSSSRRSPPCVGGGCYRQSI
jgi:hypothetical protein